MSDVDPWSIPPEGIPKATRGPMRVPWWPLPIGAALALMPFCIIWLFLADEAPAAIDSELVLVAIITGAALPATIPVTIVYAIVLTISRIRLALHHRRMRTNGEII